MTDDTARSIDLARVGLGRYEATNVRGGTLRFGSGQEGDEFTPVELLLTAIAGCSAADVDFITAKRAEPTRFEVRITGDKVRDETGNHMTNLSLTFDIAFPDGEAGDAARAALPRSVAQSHDRLCTVSRTVELPTPIGVTVADTER
ncbi:MAG TPA: OsmC family protein [Nocardioidaceae bacterium]|nr:OsmC family protein [Nocardioidaceae bacterium]